MHTFKRIAGATAVALACTALAASAQAAEKISIMVGGINKIIYLPAKLAESLGYFKDEGLKVELQSQPAGVDAENQLIAGAVQGVVGFYDHTIDLQAKGKEIQAIAVFCICLRLAATVPQVDAHFAVFPFPRHGAGGTAAAGENRTQQHH